MDPSDQPDPPPAEATAPPAAELTDRLDHVVDDTGGREDAVEWTMRELVAGRTFDDVAADLLSQGWDAESAESIVEEARESTRRERGVRTREDVVIGVSRKFGKTMRRVRWLIIIGVIIVAIAISMMLKGGE
ncbi:hypothetical protein [Humisphaera borealis]|uniref:Uncharacterized protein n=1 Tax=Humisphaera borealis TaxID=2807512 RepID=A0A7M2WV45_9BACT|nr:hypothetical protein [Humisphaera borealis]QOV89092.1 hypothetical protein IPV69_23195 [Humisphaera borealis]